MTKSEDEDELIDSITLSDAVEAQIEATENALVRLHFIGQSLEQRLFLEPEEAEQIAQGMLMAVEQIKERGLTPKTD